MAMNRRLKIILGGVFFMNFCICCVKGSLHDDIRAALAALSSGSHGQPPTDKIKNLDFNEESKLLIMEVLHKSLTWENPLVLQLAIEDVVGNWANKLKLLNVKNDTQKIFYNNQVGALKVFAESLNKIKVNLIKWGKDFPVEIVIEPEWKKDGSKLNFNQKNALDFFAQEAPKDINDDGAKKHINILNAGFAKGRELINYFNTNVGRNDESFKDILRKVKKLLDSVSVASKVDPYAHLREFFQQNEKILKEQALPQEEKPTEQESPSPLSLHPNPLKDKLVLLKTDLSKLHGKLKLLSVKLVSLKKCLEPRNKFDNTQGWWQQAIDSDALNQIDIDSITKKWKQLKETQFEAVGVEGVYGTVKIGEISSRLVIFNKEKVHENRFFMALADAIVKHNSDLTIFIENIVGFLDKIFETNDTDKVILKRLSSVIQKIKEDLLKD